jgi:hypothetical protein
LSVAAAAHQEKSKSAAVNAATLRTRISWMSPERRSRSMVL